MEDNTKQKLKEIEGLKKKMPNKKVRTPSAPKIKNIGQFNFKILIDLFLIIQKLKGVTGEDSDKNLKELIEKYIYITSRNDAVTNKTYQSELEKYKQEIFHQKKIESIQYFNKYFENLIKSFWSNTSNKEIGNLKLKNNNAKVV